MPVRLRPATSVRSVVVPPSGLETGSRVRLAATGSGRSRRPAHREAPAPMSAPSCTSGCSCSCGTPPCPSASISARRTTSCTSDCSRNRTSALVGMHVDVDRVRRHLDEQVHLGAALLDRRDAVGIDDRVRDRPVLDDPPVDEHVLRSARRSLLGERRDVAADPQAARLLPHLEQVVPLAVQLIQPIAQRSPRAGTAAPCVPPLVSVKPISGIGQRQLRGDARHLRGLGGVGLQELAPRRQVVEEIVDLDDGAFGGGRLDDRRDRRRR